MLRSIMNKMLLSVLTITLVLSLSISMPLTASAATKSDAVNWALSREGQQSTLGGTQCVALINEYLNRFWGFDTRGIITYAYQIKDMTFPNGWSKVGTPQPGDIAVYSAAQMGNTIGHVAIVVQVNSATDYYTMEQYYDGDYCLICGVKDKVKTHKYKRTIQASSYIRPNWDAEKPAVLTYDIGTDFYATISLGAFPNSFVSINGNLSAGNNAEHIFYFTRNSNGSYAIRSKVNNKLLDVLNFGNTYGAKVQFVDGGAPNTAQQWRIQKVGDLYFLAPECALNLVLDLNPIDKLLHLWTPNGSWVGGTDGKCQLFNIRIIGSSNVADGVYKIQGLDSGKYLDIMGSSNANGAIAHLWEYSPGDNQRFYFERLPDDTYKITAVHSGKSLEVRNSGMGNGDPIAQWDFDANYGCKRWYVIDCGSGYYKLINKNSGKVLDVAGFGTANGTVFQQCGDNGSAAQRFKLLPMGSANIANGIYTIQGKSGKYIVPTYDPALGNDVFIHQENIIDGYGIARDFHWEFTRLSDDTYKIVNLWRGQALDVVGGSTASGVKVQTYNWNDSPAQHWYILDRGGGWYEFVAKCSGNALDVYGNGTANYTNIQQYIRNNSDAQQFRIALVNNPIPPEPEDPRKTWSGNNHLYQVFDEALTWTQAKVKAQQLGGYLATVTSANEWNYIYSLLGSAPRVYYWLGGTDAAKEGAWTWVTGEAWSFSFWNPGEPNNDCGIEHYLMLHAPNSGKWNDAPDIVYARGGYIVEWDPIP